MARRSLYINGYMTGRKDHQDLVVAVAHKKIRETRTHEELAKAILDRGCSDRALDTLMHFPEEHHVTFG